MYIYTVLVSKYVSVPCSCNGRATMITVPIFILFPFLLHSVVVGDRYYIAKRNYEDSVEEFGDVYGKWMSTDAILHTVHAPPS